MDASDTSAPTTGAADLADQALSAAQSAVASLSREAGVGAPSHSVGPGAGPLPPGTAPRAFDLPAFSGAAGGSRAEAIELLADVNLNVKIELGRTRMLVEDVLRLGEGSVVELDKLAGDPVDIYVNERHVARGEVLVLNDNFCVRINEIVAPVGDAGGHR